MMKAWPEYLSGVFLYKLKFYDEVLSIFCSRNIRCLYAPYFHPDVFNFFAVTLRMEMDFGPAAKVIHSLLFQISERYYLGHINHVYVL